ncbi:MAG: hypothetical protein OCC49_17985 [Fibrobacterales bacterium]
MIATHSVYFRCVSPKVKEKLYDSFEEIIRKQLLDFHVKPRDLNLKSNLEGIKEDINALIFFEIDASNISQDHAILDEIHNDLIHNGNQVVLLCSEEFDFFEFAQMFNIGNIILSHKFDANLVMAMTKRLLGEHFFGPYPFFLGGFTKFDKKYDYTGMVYTPGFAKSNFTDFKKRLDTQEQAEFNSFVSELMINALAYSIHGITPEQRDSEMATSPKSLFVPEDKTISFRIVQDHEKYAISIKDRSGSLTLERILSKFRRHTKIGEEELPIGLTDPTGRGLFLLSRQNRLIINILNGIQTEIIIIHFNSEELNKYQSLIINERNPDYSIDTE